jgi:hypothetical protein
MELQNLGSNPSLSTIDSWPTCIWAYLSTCSAACRGEYPRKDLHELEVRKKGVRTPDVYLDSN